MVLYKKFKKNNCFEKTKYKEFFKEKLDFGKLVNFGTNKKLPIYNWFKYKEAFSKELVERIITNFNMKKEDKVIFDPFCGIGTTLLASKQLGLNYLGSDLSPLCQFITRAKLDFNRYNTKELKRELEKIKKWDIKEMRSEIKEEDSNLMKYSIFDKSFLDKDNLRELFGLKNKIENEYTNRPFVKQILNLALISILEEVSDTKKDGAFFRLIRKDNKPNVINAFVKKVNSLINSLEEYNFSLTNFLSEKKEYGDGDVKIADSRKLPFETNSVDITITSPPYLNRYDYTRIYQLELYLLFFKSFEELRNIRYNTIRSHVEAKYKDFGIFNSEILKERLEKLSKRELNNQRIPYMIQGYFDDMFLTMKELYRVTKKKGIIVFVVGSTRFSGVSIPVDTILLEIGEQSGFTPVEVWITGYKGNTPQQIQKYGLEAVRESIVILRKD